MSDQSATNHQPSAIRTWLQLFRAPNLFTVPGDPLAGYVLAAYGAFEADVFYAVGASVCFYAAGLLDNDLADLAEDRAERPSRPLPSGAASPRTVALVAAVLVGAGFLLAGQLGGAALTVAAGVVGAIGLYNHVTKRLPVIGALNMGVCRGLSVLLGAAASRVSWMATASALSTATAKMAAVLQIVTVQTCVRKSPEPACSASAGSHFAAGGDCAFVSKRARCVTAAIKAVTNPHAMSSGFTRPAASSRQSNSRCGAAAAPSSTLSPRHTPMFSAPMTGRCFVT